MQLLFEVGVPGLLMYLALLLSVLLAALRHWIRGTDVMVKAMGIATVFYIGVYTITGMAGGVWLPISLLVLMLWALDTTSSRYEGVTANH